MGIFHIFDDLMGTNNVKTVLGVAHNQFLSNFQIFLLVKSSKMS